MKKSFAIVSLLFTITALAQPAPQDARSQAPHELSGYWVSLVTEDWRFRMVTAPVGDYQGVSLTQAGQELANNWNPQADLAAGVACKAYGAGGLMRIPARLHISWTDNNILSMETDAGKQTRLFKFASAQDDAGAGTLQGVSKARWELQREGRFGPVVNGSLVAVTTDMAPGYLRRNGVPYSAQASLTEYFELLQGADGQDYLLVISELSDPLYLSQAVITSTNFKRESDGSGWSPQDCRVQ